MTDGHIKKRLVFYFYTFKNFRDNRANQLHLKCLKHYSRIFDEALFVISLDETDDTNLIFETQVELLKCGFKNIQFKIHKNGPYREAQPFYNEIVKNLRYLDGITFWGHNKGTTNYNREGAEQESIDAWILGMYYLNLEFIDEVEKSLCDDVCRFYGAFLTDCTDTDWRCFAYLGTFYWINGASVWDDSVLGRIQLPLTCHQRGFAEELPGLLYGREHLASHDGIFLYKYDAYTETHIRINFLLSENMAGYENFKKDIIGEKDNL